MIERIEVNGVHTKVDAELQKYTIKKLGKLDKYMSRHVRESVHMEVFLKEAKIKTKKQYTCEVVLHLPKDTVTVKETTMNMFAAVDIVETKLKNALKKYKDKHESHHIKQRLLTKIRSRKAV